MTVRPYVQGATFSLRNQLNCGIKSYYYVSTRETVIACEKQHARLRA